MLKIKTKNKQVYAQKDSEHGPWNAIFVSTTIFVIGICPIFFIFMQFSAKILTNTLSPAYNEHCDAKESARCSQVLVVTELVVAGILLVVQCSYWGAILSHLM